MRCFEYAFILSFVLKLKLLYLLLVNIFDMKLILSAILFSIFFCFLSCENSSTINESIEVKDAFLKPDLYYRWDYSNGMFTQYAINVDYPGNYWNENSHNGMFYYLEVSRDKSLGEVVLKDLNREKVFIKLTPNHCYYKDSNSKEWQLIYENSNGWQIYSTEIPPPRYVPKDIFDKTPVESNSLNENEVNKQPQTNTETQKCSRCNGTKVENCYNCKSSGLVLCSRCNGEECDRCNFSGKLECTSCVGKGRVSCSNCSWLVPL